MFQLRCSNSVDEFFVLPGKMGDGGIALPAKYRALSKSLLQLAVVLLTAGLVAGCGKQQNAQPWDGDWQRRIEVPASLNGRCIDEKLHIDGGVWRLTAVVHSTFRCNMPTLELQYEGVLGKVVVARQTPTLDAEIMIDTLELVRVANVSRGEYDYLSDSAVSQLTDVYLGKTERTTMSISVAGDTLATPLFEPLWSVIYVDTPYQDGLRTYTRAPADSAADK